jgi:hypothetical protein
MDNDLLTWGLRIIAFISVIVISLRQKRRIKEKHAKYLRKQEASERRAHVEVDVAVREQKALLDITKTQVNPNTFLCRLKNIGYSPAKRVMLEIPELNKKNPDIICLDYYRLKNITLKPGFEVEFRIRTTDRSAKNYQIFAIWSDEYSDENSAEFAINLG